MPQAKPEALQVHRVFLSHTAWSPQPFPAPRAVAGVSQGTAESQGWFQGSKNPQEVLNNPIYSHFLQKQNLNEAGWSFGSEHLQFAADTSQGNWLGFSFSA